MRTVRVCLNDFGYARPSGGYKAHSKNMLHANSHTEGIGLEEWLFSNINVRSGREWMDDNIFNSLSPKDNYRVAFIEAFSIRNYSGPGRTQSHDVQLVVNSGVNRWDVIGEIRNLRGLTRQESAGVLSYFSRSGVINKMQSDEAAAHAISKQMGIIYPYPASKVIEPTRQDFDIDTFNCIFKVSDGSLFSARPLVKIRAWPSRYKIRYK